MTASVLTIFLNICKILLDIVRIVGSAYTLFVITFLFLYLLDSHGCRCLGGQRCHSCSQRRNPNSVANLWRETREEYSAAAAHDAIADSIAHNTTSNNNNNNHHLHHE